MGKVPIMLSFFFRLISNWGLKKNFGPRSFWIERTDMLMRWTIAAADYCHGAEVMGAGQGVDGRICFIFD